MKIIVCKAHFHRQAYPQAGLHPDIVVEHDTDCQHTLVVLRHHRICMYQLMREDQNFSPTKDKESKL